MALLSATLRVGGAESGSLEVARQEGQSISAAIAAAKQPLMALVNAEVAKAEGGAAAAEGEKGAARARRAARGGARGGLSGVVLPRADAPDVYEENVVEGDDDAEDAARLKLPQKRKMGGDKPARGAAAAGAGKAAAPME